METGFRSLFLIVLMLMPCTIVQAQDSAEPEQDSELIRPEVERREFDEALIDADDFELTLNLGYLGIEDFGVNAMFALSFSYYITPGLFTQATIGQSEGSETSYEVLAGGAPLLTDEERELSFYRINIGYNLLPGEAFLAEGVAHNTAFYISAGIGNTEFAGDDRFTYNYGAGYRFMFNDSVAFYTDFRNNVFDMDVFGENKVTNNLEFTIGASLIF